MPERGQGRGASLRRKVIAAHRHLDTLFARTRTAMQQGAGAAAKALTRLREALEVHFEREERLYYPSIWALRPERKKALLEFVSAHDRFRAHLAEIAENLARGTMAEAERAFRTFAEAFACHEAGEEEQLQGLEQEFVASR